MTSEFTAEQVRGAVREELAGRIKMAMGVTHPAILSGRFLTQLAEAAADEALDFFFIPEEIETPVSSLSDPEFGAIYNSACERLRRLVPWG